MKQFPLKSTLTAALTLALTLTFSCSGGDDPDGDTTGGNPGTGGTNANVVYGADVPYQGETYKTVKIGSQTWMARNLNYDPGTGNSSCYDNSSVNCTKYGRLYDWSTAMDLPSKCNSTLSTSDADCTIRTPNHRGICPSGWHIPSDAEWDALMTAVGGEETAGTKLKATTGWNSYSGVPAGTDTYGFAALPGGYGLSDGNFSRVGDDGYWWSATEDDAKFAYNRYMYYIKEGVFRYDFNKSYYLFSVRCLQD